MGDAFWIVASSEVGISEGWVGVAPPCVVQGECCCEEQNCKEAACPEANVVQVVEHVSIKGAKVQAKQKALWQDDEEVDSGVGILPVSNFLLLCKVPCLLAGVVLGVLYVFHCCFK